MIYDIKSGGGSVLACSIVHALCAVLIEKCAVLNVENCSIEI